MRIGNPILNIGTGSNKFSKKTAVQNIISLFVVALLILFFYSNRAFDSGVNLGEDLLEQDVPHASFFVDTVQKGAFPLWNPYKSLGVPFPEVSFMGPYYPGALLYFLFPLDRAISYGFLCHIFLSAVLMFFLCKTVGLSKSIAFFCAVTWSLSSLFQQLSESGWLPQIISVSWLPGVILLFIKTGQTKYPLNIIYLLLTGLMISFIITGGVPHYTAVVLYLFMFF